MEVWKPGWNDLGKVGRELKRKLVKLKTTNSY